MAEAKNTFIKSRMNKDLDARLIPNGEYREAFNVTISKSEGEGVGSLENILGNIYKTNFGFDIGNSNPQPMECIGHFADETNNRIILFLTAYEDSSFNNLNNNINNVSVYSFPSVINYNAIVCFDLNTNTSHVLTEGNYLNFSTTHPIIGVNMIEDLLFFTDNRNQPRKINVNTAIADPTYYTNEDHISVAKYYPYNPIYLLEDVSANTFLQDANQPAYNSGMKDVVSKYLPIHTSGLVTSVPASTTFSIEGEHFNIQPEQATSLRDGDLITSDRIDSVVTVDGITIGTGTTSFTFHSESGLAANALFATDDIVYFQRQNPLYNVNWPGDPEYAKRKFLRFSYRFKFDDGEYSLMSPFTQIAFVPEQDGYFIGDKAVNKTSTVDGSVQVGQESRAYETTIVEFMQNKINDYNLMIVAPSKLQGDGALMNFSEINSLLKVTEIDILLKPSDSQNVTVVDTLEIEDFGSLAQTYYNYNYQSKKPWRVLPENEITRVSDAVPVRALAQEVAGNRVIYGNFLDKHSSPINLDYTMAISDKFDQPFWNGTGTAPTNYSNKEYYIRKEYQNHTLKQNRTYQVGIVLSDRYGRQSNVILSKLKSNTDSTAKGDTIYHRYKSVEQNLITDNTSAYSADPRDTWPGDALQATFYSPIPIQQDEGYPGAFSTADGAIVEVTAIVNNADFGSVATYTDIAITATPGSGATVTFNTILDPAGSGKYIIDLSTLVLVTQGSGYNQGNTATIAASGSGGQDVGVSIITAKQNVLGWHSYKFVVKQQEQEYYNAYLPGALAGYPIDQTGVNPSSTALPTPEFNYPVGREKMTSHIVLINDNINKIPRDLTEVGPDQLKFRSSERVYPRVKNILTATGGGSFDNYSSTQVDPETKFDTVVSIGTMQDLELGDTVINSVNKTIPSMFYLGSDNPLIGRVETNSIFGVSQVDVNSAFTTNPTQGPVLAVYETAPVESNLELFYETSTSGLVNELNRDIEQTDNTIPVGISINEISWSEGDAAGTAITSDFRGIGPGGAFLDGTATIELIRVTTTDNVNVTGRFVFNQVSAGVYNITLGSYSSGFPGWIFKQDSAKNNFRFRFKVTRTIDNVSVLTIVNGELFNRAANQVIDPTTTELTRDQISAAVGIAAGSTGSAVFTSRYGQPSSSNYSFGDYAMDVQQVDNNIINFGPIGMYKSDSVGISSSVLFANVGPYLDIAATSLVKSDYLTSGLPNPQTFDLNQTASWPTTTSGIMYLQASNGMFGSHNSNPPFNPTETSFTTIGSLPVNSEVVWSIPRMYQVSAFSFNPQANPQTGANMRLLEVVFGSTQAVLNFPLAPAGPIYWANDAAQLNTSLGGEATVGQLYNGGLHYWPDLKALVTGGETSIMTLQDGANSFYDTALSNRTYNDVDIVLNSKNLIYYLGGIDSNGLGPTNTDMKFYVYEDNTVVNGPSKAYLHVGNKDGSSSGGGGAPYYASQGSSLDIEGNGLPGGRYVVTVRATDANGTGQYFEWDLPIILSPWSLNPSLPQVGPWRRDP